VHDVKSFKPDPAVYAHFLKETGSTQDETWLVSGNPFDVIGAHMAGWHTAWVRRNPANQFDPWGIDPDVMVTDTSELPMQLGTIER
jgi:2-haloacid dehalogenase